MRTQHLEGLFSDGLKVGHNMKFTTHDEFLIEEVEKFVPYNPPLLMTFFEPGVGKIDRDKRDACIIAGCRSCAAARPCVLHGLSSWSNQATGI